MVTNRFIAGGAAVLAFVALIVVVAPHEASAQEASAQEGDRKGFFGEITLVEPDAIEFRRQNGEPLRLRVDVSDPDVIRRADATGGVVLEDLFEVGSRIATLAEMRENEWWAVKLSTVRARAVEAHITVTVIHVSGTTAIAETDSGDEVVAELDFQPPEELQGQVVTFVGRRLEDRRFRATAAKTVRAIVKRLDKHVEQKQDQLNREGDSSPARKKLQELKARLERSVVQQMKRFTEVLVKLPPESRPALEIALENLKREFKAALEVIGKPPEERDRLLDHRRLDGIIDGVDLAAGVVSIRTRSDAIVGASLGDDTVVKVGREDGALEDLRDGDRVHVRFGPEGDVKAISVITDVHAKGRIEQIDIEARTLTLALDGGVLLTLSVSDDADVHVGEDKTAFGQVEVGTVLHVTYDSRLLVLRKAVLERRAELELEVVRVDREAGTITGRTPDGQEHTIRLAGKANIIVAGRRVGVAAIKVGNRVAIVVDKRDDSAVRVESRDDAPGDHARKARGIPAGIDADSGALTLELGGGGQLTVVVGELTEIEVDGEPRTLNDILSDSLVQVSYDPETGAALAVHARTKEEPSAFLTTRPPQDDGRHDDSAAGDVVGIVGAIDIIEHTITVFTEARRVVKLRVFENTEITVGGEPVDSVAGIQLAAPVKVRFGPGREALEIHARTEAVDLATVRKEDGRKAGEVKNRVVRALAIHLMRPEIEGGPIVVTVTLNQRPVDGASVFVNGHEVGDTDDHGLVEVELPADGDVITFTATFGDHKTALRIKRATADRPASVIRLTVFGKKVEGETLRCVRKVLGRLPASDRDATDEEKRKVTTECFDRDELRDAATRLIDLRNLNCIREALGGLPGDRDLTEDEKLKIEAECFDGRSEANGGPRIDLRTLNCIRTVLGHLPVDRDLTEDEIQKVAAECLQRHGDGLDSNGGPRFDLRTLECVVKLIGRQTDGSDLSEDEKRKVSAECLQNRTDGTNGSATGLRLDLRTLECVVKLIGRQTDGSDLSEDEKRKISAECLSGGGTGDLRGEHGTDGGSESGRTDTSDAPSPSGEDTSTDVSVAGAAPEQTDPNSQTTTAVGVSSGSSLGTPTTSTASQ